jgi:hypothetical protein
MFFVCFLLGAEHSEPGIVFGGSWPMQWYSLARRFVA